MEEILKRIESKLDKILEILEETILTDEEIEELDEISDRMNKGEKVHLKSFYESLSRQKCC